MIIKLYKRCILTNAYSEVFDAYHKDANGKTALDRYLETLEQKTVAIPHTYVTNSGKISFDLNDDGTEFYEFNYMSIKDEVNNFTRFCFIDAVTVVNGIAVVSYIEDLWSNYSPSMTMRKSLLTRSRILDYGSYRIPFYSPGMEYQGNNFLKMSSLDLDDDSTIPPVNIFAQLQLYKMEKEGEVSQRIVTEICIGYMSDGKPQYNIPSMNAMLLLQDIITNSSVKQVISTAKNDTWYYEISNIVVLPSAMNVLSSGIDGTGVFTRYQIQGTTTIFQVLNFLDTTRYTCKTYHLEPNFKQFQVGVFSTAYSIVQNGTSVDLKTSVQVSAFNFSLYLEMQNQIYEITNAFKLNIPISVQTADVTQQQATVREVAELNAKLGIAKGGLKVAQGANDIAMGSAKIAFGATTGQVGSIIGGAEQASNAPFKMGSGIIDIIGSVKQLEVANRAMYTTNKGIQAESNAFNNCRYGICVFETIPDNEVEVQANIDNTGYVCNEIVDDLLKSITTDIAKKRKWNVMQFEYVNIYGNFTQRIADSLRDILCAGFKIWYDETTINI